VLPTLCFVISLTGIACAQPSAGFVVPRDQFLLKLDLQKPELSAVKQALEANDRPKAEREFIAFWRQRPLQSFFLTDWDTARRDQGYKTEAADAELAGRFNDGYSVYDAPPGGLDWYGCPLSCVTRFPLLPAPRQAFHHTRDPKYLRFIVDHILGYIRAYPIEEFAGKSAADGWTSHTVVAKPWYWCMIPERLYELAETLPLIRASAEVSDEELLTILHRLYEECGYLETQIQHWVDLRHNGGCAMIRSLAMAATILQDFPRAQRWLDYSAELTDQYTRRSFYPDGMCVELTTAYSQGTSAEMQAMAYALRARPAVAALKPHLAAMITCLAALVDPLGITPAFGDLSPVEFSRGICLPAAEWTGLTWIKALVDRTGAPSPPFVVWPAQDQEARCGYYTMRNDWTPQARFLAIDGGPWGTTHQHGDRLSFVVTALGARFIIDPPGTRYASNSPGSFISRQCSGFLHNTITVDGVDEFMGALPLESKAPLTNRWEHGGSYSLFAGSYSFRPVKPVDWERRVLFVDGAYWLLQDVLTGDQPEAEVEQNFQFEADIQTEFDGAITVATAPNGAKLALVPLQKGLTPRLSLGDKEPHASYWPDGKPKLVLASEDGRDQEHGRGWTGRNSDRLTPAPAVTYTGKLKLPAVITMLIVPLDKGQTLRDRQSPVPLAVLVSHDPDVWRLSARTGSLRFESSPQACRIMQ
jgi:Heparinase II/III-like protein/Heparinase II/III N-terminus